MKARRILLLASVAAIGVGALLFGTPPPPARSQAPDVLLNVIRGGAGKLNVFMPDFTVTGAPDPGGLSRSLAEVTANDLKFSTLFSVVGGQPALPVGNAEAMQKVWGDAAAAGAHAALQGMTMRATVRPTVCPSQRHSSFPQANSTAPFRIASSTAIAS